MSGVIKTKKERINMEIDASFKERIVKLRCAASLTSVAALIKKAINLFELISEHIKSGGKVLLVDRFGHEETLKIL